MNQDTEAIHEALAMYGWGRAGVSLEQAAERLLRDLQRVVVIQIHPEKKKTRKHAQAA
jgi:hypothetical protein